MTGMTVRDAKFLVPIRIRLEGEVLSQPLEQAPRLNVAMKTSSPRGVLTSTEIVGFERYVARRGAPNSGRQAGNLSRENSIFGSGLALWLIVLLLASGCSVLDFRLPAIGKAGKIRTAKRELAKPGAAGANTAVRLLEAVVKEDPFYRDTLTLLGRAYYQQRRYPAALQILQRAVLVNNEDEIAWLTLALTQLRMGDDQRGLESLKGGLSLLYQKATKYDYLGYESWDVNKLVQSSIRRAIFQVQKGGLDNKQRLIRYGELILIRIDNEVADQEGDKVIEDFREGSDDEG